MPGFDPNLDQTLFTEEKEFEKTKLSVMIKQYNEGEKKIQISRENKRGEDWQFAKLGRLTKEEAEAIIPMLQKAVENI